MMGIIIIMTMGSRMQIARLLSYSQNFLGTCWRLHDFPMGKMWLLSDWVRRNAVERVPEVGVSAIFNSNTRRFLTKGDRRILEGKDLYEWDGGRGSDPQRALLSVHVYRFFRGGKSKGRV